MTGNKIIRIILILVLYLIGCENKGEDYRDNFIGEYYCHKTGSDWCIDTVYERYDTNVNVLVEKGGKDMIKIFGVESIIDETGVFGDYDGSHPHSDYKFFEGKIFVENDSISFNTYQGGLGCAVTMTYEGKKVNTN